MTEITPDAHLFFKEKPVTLSMILNRVAALLFVCISVTSCVTMKQNLKSKKITKSILEDEVLQDHFTGFVLHDPEANENLIELNADKFFTPASNTKLITFYGGLMALGDSIPGLIYETRNDTLFFTGTGDPTFLNPDFNNQVAFDFISNSPLHLAYVTPNFKDDIHAPGWTWEDYEYYFQAERSGFPVYANEVHFIYDTLRHEFDILPRFFEDQVQLYETFEKTYSHARNLHANIFHFAPDTARSAYKNRIPFQTSNELTLALLQDTLHRKVHLAQNFEFEYPQTIYSIESNDIYALMLKRSDNFIAEQLQYLATSELKIEMNSTAFRNQLLLRELYPYREQLVWKDGSGLSRYNLVTPQFMISLMKLILAEITIDRFKSLLPTGGTDGTIKGWYKPEEGQPPYIYAKTGTLSNNHNLTGIIHTQSGKDLLFTFMNNNYRGSSYPVKSEMQKILKHIHETY
ncbi:D-alanyl-D-alanine carboxypeptidase [Reichenbachiella agariperforans]|uniref:D-alanyl-D-alanine carboxypeptidase n=1 Tax=Reichenbachiella agariperforans TaxID=156994 RepID=UPI001C09B29A|nr:D-alanyl-D-alanine carboxypeptidase [Reichenbachiella agariperforans]MBU2913777.1 D-alanyl-D-alanine carboxypeptidase [Reichenbachiella agariperforans]